MDLGHKQVDVTSNGDLAEDGSVTWRGTAIPATVAKLFLTLSDSEMCSVRNTPHHVGL